MPKETSSFAGSAQDDSIIVIDTVLGISMFLDSLEFNVLNDYPEICLDIEGTNLSRHGTMSVLSIFVPWQQQTYLIHVATLGKAAFNTPGAKEGRELWTLERALDHMLYAKVCFDVRNDSDALFGLFGIELRGVIDLQLMELAVRNSGESENGAFVNGLSKCITHATTVAPSKKRVWKAVKEAGIRMFAPEKGGSFAVFERLPMPPTIVQYCANDVKFLPNLLDLYLPLLDDFWRGEIKMETDSRLICSRKEGYVASGPHKTQCPWSWTTKERVDENLRCGHDRIAKSNKAAGNVQDADDLWRHQSEVGDKVIVPCHNTVRSH